MAGVPSFGPNHDHHPARQMANSNDPGFGVVDSVINPIDRKSSKNLLGVHEIKTTRIERGLTFGRVKRDFHAKYCSHV